MNGDTRVSLAVFLSGSEGEAGTESFELSWKCLTHFGIWLLTKAGSL